MVSKLLNRKGVVVQVLTYVIVFRLLLPYAIDILGHVSSLAHGFI